MTVDPKVMDRLQKLVAMEESARQIGSQAEADAFAQKVAELLTANRLSRADVRARENVAQPKIDSTYVRISKKLDRWQVLLAQSICHMTGCGVLFSGNAAALMFVGIEEDRAEAERMWARFETLGLALGGKESTKAKPEVVARQVRIWGEGCFGRQSQAMKEWRSSWYLGFADAIGSKIRAEVSKRMQEAAGTTALVWVNKNALAVQEKTKELATGKPKVVNPYKYGNADAYQRGSIAGQSTSLHQQNLTEGGRP